MPKRAVLCQSAASAAAISLCIPPLALSLSTARRPFHSRLGPLLCFGLCLDWEFFAWELLDIKATAKAISFIKYLHIIL